MKIHQIIKIEKNKAYQDEEAKAKYIACGKIVEGLINYLKTGNINNLSEIKKQKESLVNIVTSCIESSAELKSKYGNKASLEKDFRNVNNVTELVEMFTTIFKGIADNQQASSPNNVQKQVVGAITKGQEQTEEEKPKEDNSQQQGQETKKEKTKEGKSATDILEEEVNTAISCAEECKQLLDKVQKAEENSKAIESNLNSLLDQVTKAENDAKNAKTNAEQAVANAEQAAANAEKEAANAEKLKKGGETTSEHGDKITIDVPKIKLAAANAEKEAANAEKAVANAEKAAANAEQAVANAEQAVANAEKEAKNAKQVAESAAEYKKNVEENVKEVKQATSNAKEHLEKAKEEEKAANNARRVAIDGEVSGKVDSATAAEDGIEKTVQTAEEALKVCNRIASEAPNHVEKIKEIAENVKRISESIPSIKEGMIETVKNAKNSAEKAKEISITVTNNNINSIDDLQKSKDVFNSYQTRNKVVTYLKENNISIEGFKETINLLKINADSYINWKEKMNKLGITEEDLSSEKLKELGYDNNATEFIKALERLERKDRVESLKDAIKFGFKGNLSGYNDLIKQIKETKLENIEALIEKFKEQYKENYKKDNKGKKFEGEVPADKIPKGEKLVEFAKNYKDELAKSPKDATQEISIDDVIKLIKKRKEEAEEESEEGTDEDEGDWE